MSKSQTPTRKRKLFNIDEQSKKYYPLDPVLNNTSSMPVFRKVVHHIPGTLRCLKVSSYRKAA